MKKIILSLILIISCSFMLVGCNVKLGPKYWEETSTALTTFFASEKFKSVIEPTYNSSFDELCTKSYGKMYNEVKEIYDQVLQQCMFGAQKYANVFVIIPENDNAQTRAEFEKIIDKLDNLEKTVDKFVDYKQQSFLKYIDFTNEEKANSDIEKERLTKFEIKYIDLLNTALDLSQTIYNVYTKAYFNFMDTTNLQEKTLTDNSVMINLKLAVNTSNLLLTKSAIKVISTYVNQQNMQSAFAGFWQNSKNFYEQAVIEVYQDSYVCNIETFRDNFAVWKSVYDMFVQDSKKFEEIAGSINVDTLQRCNNNADEYAKKVNQPQVKPEVEFYLNFYKNVQILHQYSLDLIG